MKHRCSPATVPTRIWSVVVAAALAVPGAGRAQAPAAPPPAPLIRTQIDLGFVSTSGNSSVRTLNVGEQLTVKPDPWKFTQTFAIVNGYTGGVETVNTLTAGLRADYAVGAHVRLFALGNFTRNRFAGIAQRFEEALGLSYGVLTGPTHVLDVEAGAGRNQQTGLVGLSHQTWVSRAAAHYKLSFTSHAYFDQKIEATADFQNARDMLINAESALVAPIAGHVALKLGYIVHFANQPQPGFKKADTILSAGLQLQF
jgi:putative salt-induced outer membrane protein